MQWDLGKRGTSSCMTGEESKSIGSNCVKLFGGLLVKEPGNPIFLVHFNDERLDLHLNSKEICHNAKSKLFVVGFYCLV